ncbi:hypothetical protein [Colwellia psychrerythraea]|uniref:Uncharacterized protein n=1 Tax=Colwellia psychrerythraea TaxID=28229 RepID=A0A099KBH9_COLPS|nr:hypothetical protein [Colwellia psychrerythraea]KGJ87635.1 hypothetical protein ND2E_4373 [Colwellia psychrerythraea]
MRFNDDVIEVLRPKLAPDGIISFNLDDLLIHTNEKTSYIIKELKGDSITQLEQNLDNFLHSIISISKNELTVESMIFILRCNTDFLFSQYQILKLKFEEVTTKNNIWFGHGVLQHIDIVETLQLSVFYFRGDMKITGLNSKPINVCEKFLAQIEYVNKCLERNK